VKQESVGAVSFHWGICRTVVQKWRKALEVPEHNPGTRQLLHRARTDLEPENWKRAEVRATNRAEILPRRPLVHERSHSLRRPAASQLMKERFARSGHVNPEMRVWTPPEDNLVGSGPDDEIARKLGRTRIAVATRRRTLGIASWNYTYHRLWTDKEEALLGVVPDRKLVGMLQRPFKGIQARRELKGLPPAEPLRRHFTPEEDALLGTKPDEEVARILGREVMAVATRRQRLGIPLKNPLIHHWTPQEDKLLGTKPDREIARELHRTLSSVQDRRQRLDIPNAYPKQKICGFTISATLHSRQANTGS
jgi:hypothetical protein